MMALGEATGAKFNYIPYGGGNPSFIAMLSGETEVGALPIANTLALKDKFKVLGVFNSTNMFAAQTENAPTINAAFGTSIPDLSSSRSWAVHTQWAEANPQHFEMLEKTAKEAHASPVFRDAWVKTGNPIEALVWGDRKTCHRLCRRDDQAGAALREAAHRARQDLTPRRRRRRHERCRTRAPRRNRAPPSAPISSFRRSPAG